MSKTGETSGGVVAGGQLVGPVPGDGHHPHARVVERPHSLQLAGQSRAALDCQQAGGLPRREGCLHFSDRPAAGHAVLVGLCLPVEGGGAAVKEDGRLIAPHLVRHENSEALDPLCPGRDLTERQLKGWIIQRLPLPLKGRVEISGESVAVKIKQSCHGKILSAVRRTARYLPSLRYRRAPRSEVCFTVGRVHTYIVLLPQQNHLYLLWKIKAKKWRL